MRASFAILTAFLGAAALAQPVVPERMVFQGRLTLADGAPQTAPQNLRFSLYAAAEGGAALWTETHLGVVLSNGYYAVELGAASALGELFTGAPRWLAVALEGQQELGARMPIATTPYAFYAATAAKATNAANAANAALLGGLPEQTFARAVHVHPAPVFSCIQRTATGPLDVGVVAACAAGELLTGGGCAGIPSGSDFVVNQIPTSTGFSCRAIGPLAPSAPVTAHAVCCRIQ